MERYETAAIELVNLDEDVITASGTTNSTTTPTPVNCTYSHIGDVWVVTYDDGTTENFPYREKPYDICG